MPRVLLALGIVLLLVLPACVDPHPASPVAISNQGGDLVISLGCPRAVSGINISVVDEATLELTDDWWAGSADGSDRRLSEISVTDLPEGWVISSSTFDPVEAATQGRTIYAFVLGSEASFPISTALESGKGRDGWVFGTSQRSRSWEAYQKWVTSSRSLHKNACLEERAEPDF